MLTYVEKLVAPDYGPRKGTTGIAFHTTEGAPGKAGALATVEWQGTAANTSRGSYNYVVGIDGDDVTAVKSVARDRIAGGISRRRDAVWIADDDPGLATLLGGPTVFDPNSYLVQISIAGTVAQYDGSWPPALVDALAAMVRHLEAAYRRQLPMVGHYRFQSNRSDPGKHLIPLVAAARARQLAAAASTFVDVAADNPHRAAIEWLAATGITAGIGDGKYGPDLPVTRAQMASFIRRTVDYLAEHKES